MNKNYILLLGTCLITNGLLFATTNKYALNKVIDTAPTVILDQLNETSKKTTDKHDNKKEGGGFTNGLARFGAGTFCLFGIKLFLDGSVKNCVWIPNKPSIKDRLYKYAITGTTAAFLLYTTLKAGSYSLNLNLFTSKEE